MGLGIKTFNDDLSLFCFVVVPGLLFFLPIVLIVSSLSRWVSPGALLSLYILLIPSTLDYCH